MFLYVSINLSRAKRNSLICLRWYFIDYISQIINFQSFSLYQVSAFISFQSTLIDLTSKILFVPSSYSDSTIQFHNDDFAFELCPIAQAMELSPNVTADESGQADIAGEFSQ